MVLTRQRCWAQLILCCCVPHRPCVWTSLRARVGVCSVVPIVTVIVGVALAVGAEGRLRPRSPSMSSTIPVNQEEEEAAVRIQGIPCALGEPAQQCRLHCITEGGDDSSFHGAALRNCPKTASEEGPERGSKDGDVCCWSDGVIQSVPTPVKAGGQCRPPTALAA